MLNRLLPGRRVFAVMLRISGRRASAFTALIAVFADTAAPAWAGKIGHALLNDRDGLCKWLGGGGRAGHGGNVFIKVDMAASPGRLS